MMKRADRRNIMKDLLMSILLIAASVLAVLSLPFESFTAEASEIPSDSYFQRDAVMEVDIMIEEELLSDMLLNAAKEEYRAAESP